MKRKFLEDLGLEDEVVNKIMAENGKDLTTLKAQIDELKETVSVKDETIKQKSDKIAELEKVDIEALKKEQFELGKTEGSKEVENFKRQTAINNEFGKEFEVDGKKYKVKDVKALKGYLDDSKIEFKDDKITGLVEQLQEVVKTSPFLFDTDKPTPQFGTSTQSTKTSISGDPETMDFETYKKWRNQN